MKVVSAVVLACLLLACDEVQPTSSRQVSSPAIPSHPLCDDFVGEWQWQRRTRFFIETGSGDGVVVRSPDGPSREVVINNVRWVEETLHFDEYEYFTGPKGEKTVANPTGEDPRNGQRTSMTLTPTDDPDRLKWTLTIPVADMNASETRELIRVR